MLSVIWIAGLISGFMFPAYLIKSLRAKEENDEFNKDVILSCLTFGICVASILIITIYS